MLSSPRVKGYAWALSQPEHAEYSETASFNAFFAHCPEATDHVPGSDEFVAVFAEWERGVFDSKQLLRNDEMLSVTDVADRAGVTRTFVKDEIKRGNLSALKHDGKDKYDVYPDDFRKWMANPKRGSRKRSGPAAE